jgi:hypothetical protein
MMAILTIDRKMGGMGKIDGSPFCLDILGRGKFDITQGNTHLVRK